MLLKLDHFTFAMYPFSLKAASTDYWVAVFSKVGSTPYSSIAPAMGFSTAAGNANGSPTF